jgi:hypothetical protein
METALQEAIANAKTAKENDKNKDYVTYDEVIEMLTELLPKEREQIEQEVLNAIKWVEDNFYSNGNDFFTHIDTQVQYKRAELYKHYETNSNTK